MAEALSASLILLAAAVVSAALFQRLRLPSSVACLAAGALLGPHALGLLPANETTRLFGEIGVVFLLFTLGIEFTFARLIHLRHEALVLGGVQVLVGTLSGTLIAWWLGVPWRGAWIVGGALAMSSTAIVLSELKARSEQSSAHGEIATGMLLFQDLAAVPFLAAIPILAAPGQGALASALGLALLKAALAVVTLAALGHWALRGLLKHILHTHATELFTLTILLVALAAAWLTDTFGLSLALGAFLAGMAFGQTEYRHQVEADMRPFRDVLLALFFLGIGMHLEPMTLVTHWHWVLLLVAGLVAGKGVLVFLLARNAGHHHDSALRAGLALAHAGEFALAMLALAYAAGLIPGAASHIILASVIVSMALAPPLLRHGPALHAHLFPEHQRHERVRAEKALHKVAAGLSEHVILCGYGRVGRNTAALLERARIPWLALDLDPHRTRTAFEAGKPVYYGDATHPDILTAAGIRKARALVIGLDDAPGTLKCLAAARRAHARIPILARSRDEQHLEELYGAGASVVVPETLESGLALASALLTRLERPQDEIESLLAEVRSAHYRPLRE